MQAERPKHMTAPTLQELNVQVTLEDYRRAPTAEGARALVVSIVALGIRKSGASAGVCLGLLEGVIHRWRRQEMSKAVRLAIWIARKGISKKRPAWNDYYICYWMVTESRSALIALHRRAYHLPATPDWEPTTVTARWAINSLLSSDEAFRNAYLPIINHCPECKPKN